MKVVHYVKHIQDIWNDNLKNGFYRNIFISALNSKIKKSSLKLIIFQNKHDINMIIFNLYYLLIYN